MKRTKKKMKPIRTLIEIVAYSWWDRSCGNTYCSARVYVNKDYNNPVYVPFEYGSTDYIRQVALRAVAEQFKGLPNLDKLRYSEAEQKGIHITISIREVKQSKCKRWGKQC